MSRKRIPEGSKNILLVCHYKDGFCTVQATWDKALFPIKELVAGKIVLLRGTTHDVYVKATKNSTYISRELATTIAERWLQGKYLTVERAVLPDFPSRDWVS